ncbi:MAG TPA: aldehyde dehydrogenase family protein, partial [Verrucomicrobiota bacterium]|nr:aldehyde dehydrogenase family protein [Verrucomicrobiota bacterium]
MSTRTTERDTSPTPNIILPEMAGAIYLGTFKPAAGGKAPVLDKASREVLLEGASSNAADVAEAARTAKAAQGAWAALPPTARGDVLRKFAGLCEQYVEEISRWIVRETGSIPPKGPFEVMTSAREAIEIAALTGQPV